MSKRKISDFPIIHLIFAILLKAALFGFIYYIFYKGWSPAWLVVLGILSVANDWLKANAKSQRRIAKALARQKQLDKDLERPEWMNKALMQMWPYINKYIATVLKEEIGRKIAKDLGGFYIGSINMGTLPPQIRGIKVDHNNVHSNEVAMLVDFDFKSDCYISFVVGGVLCSIKRLKISGLLEVVIRPLLSKKPFAGGLEIAFVHKPLIEFKLENTISFLDFGGIPSEIVRRIIIDKIAAVMLKPKKLKIPFKL